MDNIEGVPPTSGAHLRSHGPIPNYVRVLLIPPTAPQVPQDNVINVEFHQSIHVIS